MVASRMAGDHLIAGVGLNNFTVVSAEHVREVGLLRYVNLITVRPTEVHNLYLELVVENGLIGLALFIALVATCLGAAWGASRRFEVLGRSSVGMP